MSIFVHVIDWNLKNSRLWKGERPMSVTMSLNSWTDFSREQPPVQCSSAFAAGADSLKTSDQGSAARELATRVEPTLLSWKMKAVGATTLPSGEPSLCLSSFMRTDRYSRRRLDPWHFEMPSRSRNIGYEFGELEYCLKLSLHSSTVGSDR